MKFKIKLLKEFDGKAIGTVLEFSDRAEGQKLIDDGIAREYFGNELKLLKPYDGKSIGEVVDIKDAEVFKSLVAFGVGEAFEEELTLEAGIKAMEERIEKRYEAKLAKFFAKHSKSGLPGGEIKVHDNWTDDPKKGFKSFGLFALDIYASSKGIHSKHMLEYGKAFGDGQNESIGADGGFLVPEGFSATIKEHPMVNPLLDLTALTDVIPIVGNSLKTPILDNADQSGNQRFGGIVSGWFKEGSAITKSQFTLKTTTQVLDDVGALVFVTSDLLEDSAIALESFLGNKAPMAITDSKNEAIIRGDGSEEPLGYIGHPGTVQIARDGADAVSLNDIVRIVGQSTNRINSVWVINQELYAVIAQIRLGEVRALVPTALDGVVIDTLQGRPVIWTDLASAIGDTGDIALCDFSGYQTLLKNNGAVRVDTSIHLKFDTLQTAFRFVTRMAGQPLFDTQITPKFGTKKLSAFVTLDTNP